MNCLYSAPGRRRRHRGRHQWLSPAHSRLEYAFHHHPHRFIRTHNRQVPEYIHTAKIVGERSVVQSPCAGHVVSDHSADHVADICRKSSSESIPVGAWHAPIKFSVFEKHVAPLYRSTNCKWSIVTYHTMNIYRRTLTISVKSSMVYVVHRGMLHHYFIGKQVAKTFGIIEHAAAGTPNSGVLTPLFWRGDWAELWQACLCTLP